MIGCRKIAWSLSDSAIQFAKANPAGWEIPSFHSKQRPQNDMDYLEKLGENIRRRIVNRSDAGSIELFAHENQIPKSTLSELLNGKNDPRLSTLAKICAGLEIRLSDLFADPAMESLVAEATARYSPSSKRSSRKSPARSTGGKSSRDKAASRTK
jgi:transcriptional regulator with XRE-family HTH domain